MPNFSSFCHTPLQVRKFTWIQLPKTVERPLTMWFCLYLYLATLNSTHCFTRKTVMASSGHWTRFCCTVSMVADGLQIGECSKNKETRICSDEFCIAVWICFPKPKLRKTLVGEFQPFCSSFALMTDGYVTLPWITIHSLHYWNSSAEEASMSQSWSWKQQWPPLLVALKSFD